MPESKRAFTAADLNRINSVQDPQISPDGRFVAFVRVTPDALTKTYKRNIWLLPLPAGDAFQLTRGGRDGSPRWSPDGSWLAFTSERGEKSQIYLLPTAAPGGEARALTALANGAHSPDWSPDGKRLAFLAPMSADERQAEDSGDASPEAADTLASKQQKERQAEDERSKWDPRPVWRIPYRRDTSFVDERYDQVYVKEVAEAAEANARRLTDLDASYGQPRWSPDGAYLYTHRTTAPLDDEPWRAQNIFRLTVDSGAEAVLSDGSFKAFAPTPSPDGKWLAYYRSHIGITDMPERVVVMSADGGESRVINEAIDREALDMAWSPQGMLALAIESEGNVLPWTYEPEADELTQAHAGIYEIEQLSAGDGGLMAMSVSTPANPQELYLLRAGELREATAFNHDWLAEVNVQAVHELRYQSAQGEVQGWYLLPAGYEHGKTYPVALNIHGGPHAAWGFSTRTMWHEWQLHAAQGYAVFYCNPHGSGGYGAAFMRKLHAAWGPVAMDDIMAGLDAFLALGIGDGDRMAITGGSYGGYMTAWIIAHSDRFKAAVSQRGVYNLCSFYGTTDVPLLISNEFDAEPWERQDVYWDNSPLKYAAAIKTPLLLIHSENDFRVPIEQAEQLFAWVRRATDTPVRMLRYPREGHELSRSGEPGHRVSRLQEMIAWFQRYLNEAEQPS